MADNYQGFGTLISANGDFQEGEFYAGALKNGYSKTTTYVGNVRNTYKEGYGVYNQDGYDKYEGEYHMNNY